MKRQIRLNSTESFVLEQQSFESMYILLEGFFGATSPNNSFIDLSKLRITLTAEQSGSRINSSFNAVGPVLLNAVKTLEYNYVEAVQMAPTAPTCKGIEIGQTKTQVIVPILDSGFVLGPGDSLRVDVDTLNGLFNTTFDVNQASKCYLITEESTDVTQMDLTLPVYYPITNEKQSPAFSEKSLSEIVLLSVGTVDRNFLDNNCFNNVDISSKFYSQSYDASTLLARTFINTVNDEGYNLPVLGVYPSTIEDVNINLDIITSNVITGLQFLYIKRHSYNAYKLEQSIERVENINSSKAGARLRKY
jgi:hypothetical protein